MYLYADAKLGCGWAVFALVRAVETGLSLKAAAAAFSVRRRRRIGGGTRWLDGGRQARRLAGSLERDPRCSPRAARRASRRAVLRLSPQTGIGRLLFRRRARHGLRALDGLEGAATATAFSRRAQRPRRRPTAEWPCRAIYCTWTSEPLRAFRARSPATGGRRTRSPYQRRLDAARDEGRLRLRPRGRRRPLPARLRGAPRRREGRDGHGFRRTRAFAFFAQHGIVARRLMTENGYSYVKKPHAARAARRAAASAI